MFCFKKKVKKDIVERVNAQLLKSANFKKLLEDRGIDIERITKITSNKVVDEYGRVYLAKDHHGPWRKKFING